MLNVTEIAVGAWEVIYKAAGENHQLLFINGSWLMSFVLFVILNTIFGCLDIFGVPTMLQRFKIQKNINVPMSMSKYMQTMVVATFNMTVMVFPVLLVIWLGLAKTRMEFHPRKFPTVWRAAWDILLCIIIHDISFYYLHRWLHLSSFLYKHVHKIHHDWSAPCSMATFYCHPLEQAFVNLGSFVAGPALVGAHLSTAWTFWFLGQLTTTLIHSGYHFPFLPSSEAHDYHHQRCIDQYSTMGFLDWLHGTNKSFKKSINCMRHFTFFGLTPADELRVCHPDVSGESSDAARDKASKDIPAKIII